MPVVSISADTRIFPSPSLRRRNSLDFRLLQKYFMTSSLRARSSLHPASPCLHPPTDSQPQKRLKHPIGRPYTPLATSFLSGLVAVLRTAVSDTSPSFFRLLPPECL